MRLLLPIALALAVQLPLARAATTAPPSAAEHERTLLAVGAVVAKNLDVFQLTDAELERVIAGMRAARAGKAKVKIDDYEEPIRLLAVSRMTAGAERRKLADAKAAAVHAKDPRAFKAPSGLVFLPLELGSGIAPSATDRVTVHYRGTLVDGSEFDNSYTRGEPATFPLDGVIPCWTEGIQKMKVGGKARLVCPSSIAYGDEGRPPEIPGGATLVFEVELKGVVAPAAEDGGHDAPEVDEPAAPTNRGSPPPP
jgi:FKBP-type peptidyl-prolyl cis-trans isomerase